MPPADIIAIFTKMPLPYPIYSIIPLLSNEQRQPPFTQRLSRLNTEQKRLLDCHAPYIYQHASTVARAFSMNEQMKRMRKGSGQR